MHICESVTSLDYDFLYRSEIDLRTVVGCFSGIFLFGLPHTLLDCTHVAWSVGRAPLQSTSMQMTKCMSVDDICAAAVGLVFCMEAL